MSTAQPSLQSLPFRYHCRALDSSFGGNAGVTLRGAFQAMAVQRGGGPRTSPA
ncbi:hypothetical protein GJA_3438 [Janthinobacterium agaricidamnosum NBRC 102515 = DSM 9628]|uniref:Uncharacterized protein n=1 Tax=Janthinobacterium agaricidamnosum NBRC 102515 = DSM 9628 TaxID=1349767 RepID=W0V845_9BURK|nr:hypothetical protein GJA_3438 [Janthinobacterium agaricidamnosum NBRC 102515 = DSM 9628]